MDESINKTREPLFSLGQCVMTVGVSELVKKHEIDLLPYLKRHLFGDWGTVDKDDAEENVRSLKNGFRLLSAYSVPVQNNAVKIWIITEADRSSTTILFPEEY